MTNDQLLLIGLLGLVLGLFIWDRWRYDIVALSALLAATLLGLVNSGHAFAGFGHPATVTIAAVLIISRGLSNTGAVDLAMRCVKGALASPSMHVAALGGLGGLISSVMNNVGALALLMPVALRSSAEAKRSPAIILMPLAFSSILGGMITLIGTPPNIIVAAYRGETLGTAFDMFDFTPVGATVALAGFLFVTLIGWRLLPPARRSQRGPHELFRIEAYVTEARVPETSKAIGKTLTELEAQTEDSDAVVVGLIRGDRSLLGAVWRERIEAGDIIILEADPEGINKFVTALELDFGEEKTRERAQGEEERDRLRSEDVVLMEAVVPPYQSRVLRRYPQHAWAQKPFWNQPSRCLSARHSLPWPF